MNDFAFASTAGKQGVEFQRKSGLDFADANGYILDPNFGQESKKTCQAGKNNFSGIEPVAELLLVQEAIFVVYNHRSNSRPGDDKI